MPDGTIEVITGRERRRRWSIETKLRVVAESQEPGACVKAVAARHDIYPSLIFNWRRQMREGRLTSSGVPEFVPVRLTGPSHQGGDDQSFSAAPRTDSSGVAITLPDGTRLYIRHAAQLPLLRGVLGLLRG
jgi:transposase